MCTAECPPGSYCPEASVTPIECPAGRYGSRSGEYDPSCTGDCAPSHVCPPGSVSPTEIHCPSANGDHSDEAAHQCFADGDRELSHLRDYDDVHVNSIEDINHFYPVKEHYLDDGAADPGYAWGTN